MRFLIGSIFLLFFCIQFTACRKSDGSLGTEPPRLVFTMKFDSMQARLNNIGQPSNLQIGRAAQNPIFNSISAHHFELATNAFTPLGNGVILYKAPETSLGGSSAIDFSRSIRKGEQGEYFALKLSEIPTGTYEYLRISLAYQNYDINFTNQGADYTGTVASFIGYNTYIGKHNIKTLNQTVNSNKTQGYWAFEGFGQIFSGQSPVGATTVPNPIFATSPIPQGSCVVTAAFVDANGNPKPLVIKGGEAKDFNVRLSLSTNKSFEWVDTNGDGKFEPAAGEQVIDMGVRGLLPIIQ